MSISPPTRLGTTPGKGSAMGLLRLFGIFVWLLLPYVSPYRDRIIGGKECYEKKHPYLALLYRLTSPYCSGILINKNWVLTAAHCCKSGDIVIKLGEHNLEESTGREQMRTSAETILYNTKADAKCECECENDIMLIRLNKPADLTEYVAPIDLGITPPPLGTSCTVMGWGAITSPEETFPAAPQCVNITILETKLCEENYPCIVPENILCAGVPEGGKDSCRGDSGGPLVCDNKLHGVVSLGGDPCAQPELPAVYTNISHYVDWIQEHIGESNKGSSPKHGTLADAS
ncbi:gilatoxin-like [Eublepharis macularius]|uniref:Gilatoxin-like n=2 Tax=Eublepharis macularius TaxID=481883 RepID=A0AA97KFN8_EUBMA|nr:gilatoxin-like [Eublepharis macularius]